MKYYQLVQFGLIASTIIFLISLFILLFLIYKSYRYTSALSKKVYNLGEDITPKDVNDFMKHIDVKYIPFRSYTMSLIKSGYKLIEMEKSIDDNLKLQLKKVILKNGIVVD